MTGGFDLVFVDGPGAAHNNGCVKRRLALQVEGENRDVVMVRLDSDQARTKQAKRWAEAFKLEAGELETRLRRAALMAVEESQRRKSAAHPDVGGAPSPPPTPHTLDEVRPVFDRWMQNVDPALLDVVFGAVMAHRLDGDPVWLFVVGAPGDGKTESLRSLSTHEDIYTLSTLTPGALISGYITDGEDPSLLPRIDGKVLVIKDFTTVLQMPNEARAEVLGTLRDAYDGEACKCFGTGEVKRYRSRFGLLAAVTPAIEDFWGCAAQLGERFLRFRLPESARQAKVARALRNSNAESVMRAELAEAAISVLCQTPDSPMVPPEIEGRFIALADFIALGRSEVSRDRQGVIRHIPAPEVGTRVGKAVKKLSMGIAMARGLGTVDLEIYAIVARVGLDTVPSMRRRLLAVLWRSRTSYEATATIANTCELPTDTVKVWLDDLRILGIVQRGGDPKTGYTWNLRNDFQNTIIRAGLWPAEDMYGGGGGESAPPTEPGAYPPEWDQVSDHDEQGVLYDG